MMHDVMFRRATDEDMAAIGRLETGIFTGEQRIPDSLIPLPEGSGPMYWVAELDHNIIGAVAAWKEGGETHWGRFAVARASRGHHIGTRLAEHSFADLFAQDIDCIHMEAREATVAIVSAMGGMVTGAPTDFYEGTVTPIILRREAFDRWRRSEWDGVRGRFANGA